MNFSDERPIFLQLAEQLEDGILRGIFPEGSQIPSITEYAVAYKINPATALKGVNLLVDAGLLFKKRGVGMFVADGAREKVAEKRRERFYQDFILPLIREAEALGLDASETEKLMERGWKHEDRDQSCE